MTIESYGYISNPPDWKEGDECSIVIDGKIASWQKCVALTKCKAKHKRRPISPGEGYRILGLDEMVEGAYCYTSTGVNWENMITAPYTVRQLLELQPHILAIRVPLEKEKEIMKENHNCRNCKGKPECTCDKAETPRPLHRGIWVKCSDAMPTDEDIYFTASGNKGTGWALFRDNEFPHCPDVTHWLKLHDIPPLPEQEKREDECWKAFKQNGYGISYEIYQQIWNRALAGIIT